MSTLDLKVFGSGSAQGLRPVRGGVPLAAGAAPAGSTFALRTAAGEAVPLQPRVLTTWPDGSARWVLLDFLSSPPSEGCLEYRLTAGGESALPEVPAEVGEGGNSLVSGATVVGPADGVLLGLAGRAVVELLLEDENGEVWRAVAEETSVEAPGPVRATLCLKGAFRNAAGARWMDFRLWVSAYAGLSRLLLEPLLIVNAEEGLVQKLRSLRLVLRPSAKVSGAVLGGGGDVSGEVGEGVRLLQVDDMQYRVERGVGGSGTRSVPPTREGADTREEGRAPGWVEISAGGPLAVALRDFWQQWPKGLSVDAESLSVDLFPAFTAGSFDHLQPWYKHDYLFCGECYRLREGQSRRWQVWVDLQGDAAALAGDANEPLIPSPEPGGALATGVWGPQMPAGAPGLAEYDRWAAQLFEVYQLFLDRHRDYGAMNWGDWWGERRSNWGNHEYDTPLHMFLQYARTGEPRYFHAADIAARHLAEVDVVHAANEALAGYYHEIGHDLPARAGIVHQHTIGHVAGFHPVEQIRELYVGFYREQGVDRPNPYLCLEPNNLGHVFTQGLAYQYLLTGDPWVRETLADIGENLCGLIEQKLYRFKGWDHCGRANGWTMLALAGCYEVAPTERLLAAMRSLADDALEEQDPYCGGWLYELPWGHCFCETRKHVGEAGFISAVRVNGLARYYELTQDERIPEVVRRAVTHLNNDTWREQDSDWRYTSCPASSLMRQFGVIMMALRNSVVLSGDEEHLRILRQAWETKFVRLQGELASVLSGVQAPGFARESTGKEYGATAYGCGETMGLLASLE